MNVLDDALLPVEPAVAAGVAATWAQLAAPGPTLTGADRVRAAAAARSGQDDGDVLTTAAAVVGATPWDVDADVVADLEARGLSRTAYVEVLGVASRVRAVDTAVRGLGADELALPEPDTGAPTGVVDDAARRRSAHVATVGPAGPPSILSHLPAEAAAQAELHGVLYLGYDDMAHQDVFRHGLHRTQMELVAARTSLVNHCHF